MSNSVRTDLIDLIKKDKYAEYSYELSGENYVWLDITADLKDLSLSIAIHDRAKNITKKLLGEVQIPAGSWLSAFNNKLIVDKVLIIRTSENASMMISVKNSN